MNVSFIAAVLCAALGVGVLAVPGLRFGGILLLCLAAFCGVLALLGVLAEKRRWARRTRGALLALFCAGLAVFSLLEVQIISAANGNADGTDVSCVVILGAGVDGTTPSLTLSARLDAALDYLSDKPDIPVIVSGCRDRYASISEAECMYRYLTARGVNPNRVWKEERATSTRTNFLYSKELMVERGIDPAAPFAYVTSDFHVYRAGLLASTLLPNAPRVYGIAASLPDESYYRVLEINYYIREAFALVNERLFQMDWSL